MTNIFYINGFLWLLLLLMYALGWSDLCIPLSSGLVLFSIFNILFSLAIGFVLQKKLRFVKLKNNPHKKTTITLLLILFYAIEIVLSGFDVPLVSVLQGNAMADSSFHGIKILHFTLTSFTIMYCLYLAYLFVCFKKVSKFCNFFHFITIYKIEKGTNYLLIPSIDNYFSIRL